TADGSATANLDYVATSGILTFNPGEASKTIEVPILGDFLNEGNEVFVMNLSSATGATIADQQGVATIFDNDAVIPAGADLANESCSPSNSALDRGERVTVNLKLMNNNPTSTSNL